jgi:hypothetical protein
MATMRERSTDILTTLPFSATAVASAGTTLTFTSGCAKVKVRAGGNITVKVSGSTAEFALTTSEWSPDITFNCDGVNTNTITLIGANIACTGLSYHIPGVGPTPAVS